MTRSLTSVIEQCQAINKYSTDSTVGCNHSCTVCSRMTEKEEQQTSRIHDLIASFFIIHFDDS
jgi:hypothetical protein